MFQPSGDRTEVEPCSFLLSGSDSPCDKAYETLGDREQAQKESTAPDMVTTALWEALLSAEVWFDYTHRFHSDVGSTSFFLVLGTEQVA